MSKQQPSVFLLNTAARQCEQISASPCLAWLLGWRTSERIEILNVCRFLSIGGEVLRTTETPYSLEQEKEQIEAAFPSGLIPLGCAAVFGQTVAMSVFTLVRSLSVLSAKAVALQQPQGTRPNSVSGLWCIGRMTVHMNGIGCDFEEITSAQSQFLNTHARIRWTLEMNLSVVSPSGTEEDCDSAFQRLVQLVRATQALFLIENPVSGTKKLISKESNEVLSVTFTDRGAELRCSMFETQSSTLQCPRLETHGLKDRGEWNVRGIRLRSDLLCYAPLSAPFSEIVNQFLYPALETQCRSFALAARDNPPVQELCSFHFDLEDYLIPVSVVYPFFPESDMDESLFMDKRRSLHRRFLRKEDRRVFVKALSQQAAASASAVTDKLLSIHERLPKKSFPEGGMVATVAGTYEYCHYGHDSFNDAGWGCAYRSLQTVFSWFVHQRYTQLPIPSHRKIQEVLVEIGDKEGRFYGSREWIGSIEVGTVLEEMLGTKFQITSKRADQDVSSIARELVHHFRTQGTPVSIGGGVLAYTLLGIYFNDKTADVELLILDPHYTGKDNVESIIKGGWIAWKKPTDSAAAGGPLFVKNTHYNFMCTFRPSWV